MHLFFHQSLMETIGLPKGMYALFLRHGVPLLLLPRDRKTALLTLRLYAPQKIVSKLAVLVLKVLIFSGLHTKILPRFYVEKKSAVSFLVLSDADSCGFLLCNPEHGFARCVGIVRRRNDFLLFKLCDKQGAQNLRAEHTALMRYEKTGVPNIPHVGRFFETEDCAGFEMERVDGKSVCTLDTPETIALLRSWLQKERILLRESPFFQKIRNPEISEEEVALWQELRIQKSFYHGDFFPYNLIKTKSGMKAIDLEWSSLDGLAGIDVAVGLAPITAAKLSPEAKEYLAQTGWTTDTYPILERVARAARSVHVKGGNA